MQFFSLRLKSKYKILKYKYIYIFFKSQIVLFLEITLTNKRAGKPPYHL